METDFEIFFFENMNFFKERLSLLKVAFLSVEKQFIRCHRYQSVGVR